MTAVSLELRTLLAAGHHRQPRTTPTSAVVVDPTDPPQPVNDYTVGTPFHHHFKSSFTDADGTQYDFLFASASDGSQGNVGSDVSFTSVPVGHAPMTVVGWYLPHVIGSGTEDECFVDAFSENQGLFVSDTLFNVTSNPALNSDANVIGEVPTTDAGATIVTGHIISTGEHFDTWITTGTANGDTVTVPGGVNSVAIATFNSAGSGGVPNVNVHAEEGVKILWGLIAGGDGVVLTPHGPKHVDPGWGPFAERVLRAGAVARLGQSMEHAGEITRLCLNEVHAAVKQLDAGVSKVADRVAEF
jgi:hypothetical protein